MEHESIVWPKPADDIIRYSALVYQKGLVSAAGGNVSARLGGDMLITGSNVPLRAVTYEGLVLCDAEGHVKRAAQGLKPSKETRFHLDVYRLRPEINYIIHAHPTYSVLWTLQKKPLPLYTESAKLKLGEVPIVPDRAPGSTELADVVAETAANASADTRAFLMEGHGILVMGKTMEECFDQAELLEDTAKIAFLQQLACLR